MSDLIVNVRQISQYTAQTQAQATDNLLIQRGGQGGAYYSLPVSGIVGAFTGPTGQIGIGLPLPGDASSTGIIGSNLLMPLGCTFGWNWYRTATGTSYLAAGPALQECFTAGGLVINSAATGSASAAIATWSQILNLTTAGALTIPGTITAAPATSTAQAATLGQVNAAVAAAVVSFNGRTGAVTLQLADVTTAGGAPNPSPNHQQHHARHHRLRHQRGSGAASELSHLLQCPPGRGDADHRGHHRGRRRPDREPGPDRHPISPHRSGRHEHHATRNDAVRNRRNHHPADQQCHILQRPDGRSHPQPHRRDQRRWRATRIPGLLRPAQRPDRGPGHLHQPI